MPRSVIERFANEPGIEEAHALISDTEGTSTIYIPGAAS
jgi:hypothetical protein